MKMVGDVLREWRKLWEYETIKKAMKENKVIDLDTIFKDGKLFGYDTYFKKSTDWDGEEREYGPFTSIKDGDKDYEVRFCWNWEERFLEIIGTSEINTPLGIVPLAAQRQISFDMLFGVKSGIVKLIIEKSIDELITYFKSKEGDNDNQGNRYC